MRRNTLLSIGLLICCLLLNLPSQADAQNTPKDSTLYRVETIDNNVFVGRLISRDGSDLVFQVEGIGKITVSQINIMSLDEIKPNRIKNGKYWFDNPTATRYLFTANAIGLKSGQGYYQNTWIFFNNFAVGLSDNITLGGGLVPTFLMGASYVPVWFNPKISIPVQKDNFYLAAGGVFGGITGADGYGVGVVYGVATLGNHDSNISFGLGYGYANNEWSSSPVFNISGMVRTSQKVYIISENYFFTFGNKTTGIISAAIRYAPKHVALDFGLIRPSGNVDFIGIPWLGVTLPF